MAQDATGTPTPLQIPKYNVAVDAPSGLGFNATMDAIDTLLTTITGATNGNLVTLPSKISGYPTDGTKALFGDGLWKVPASLSALRGIVAQSGTITAGTGFSVVRSATGKYDVTFTTPFASAPVAFVTPIGGTDNWTTSMGAGTTTTGCSFWFQDRLASFGNPNSFNFVVLAIA